MPKSIVSILIFFMGCYNLTAQNNILDSLMKEGWLINFCDVPESNNIDSVNSLIEFPDELRGLEVNEKVVFRALIDTTGQVIEYKTINSAHPLLTHSAESKIHLIKFVPGDCFKGYMETFGFVKVWINFVLTIRDEE